MNWKALIALCSIGALILASAIAAWLADKTDAGELDTLSEVLHLRKVLAVPRDFHSIQMAINAADEGDIVYVDSGIYHENLILNKSISLLGAGYSHTIVDANKLSHAITISSNNAIVAGFTFQNGGYPIPAYCGVKIDNVDNVTVSNNFVTGNFVGIRLGNKQRGSNGNIIRNNILIKNRYGLFADHANGNVFYGNIITENSWNGVEIAWGGNNILAANNISHNRAYGLEIVSSTPSRNNCIFQNNFVNNSFKVSASNVLNIWDDGYPSGGNYWSDYTGVDLYSGLNQDQPGSDGIGDTPWTLDPVNRDRYPLVNPFDIPTSPKTDFVFSPESPLVGEKISFNASASASHAGDALSYVWDFGDSSGAAEAFAFHAYSENGNFWVFLNVSDSNGLWGFRIRPIVVRDGPGVFSVSVQHVIGVALILALMLVAQAHVLKAVHRESGRR